MFNFQPGILDLRGISRILTSIKTQRNHLQLAQTLSLRIFYSTLRSTGFITVFEKVLDHSLSTEAKISTDVGEIDTEIRNTYSARPETLCPRRMADSVVDSPPLLVTRLCVFFVFQKCLYVLHRPYVTRGRVCSPQTCCDAASNIVRYFNDTYKEFVPCGQLEAERCFMSNLTWHDCLLGLIALCLILCASIQSINAPDVQFAVTLQLLRRARDV